MALLNRIEAFAVLPVLVGVLLVVPALPLSGQVTAAHCDSLYGDLSGMEHCVRNYAMSIEREDIDRYASIFLDDCEFMTVTGKLDFDFVGGMPRESTIKTRGLPEEIELMKGMFGAASEIHFAFEAGTWNPVDSLAGKSCLECWETYRRTEYSIVFNADSDGKPPASVAGANRIWMYVRSVRGQWKIFRVIEKEIDDAGE